VQFEQHIINTCKTPRARAELTRGFRVRRRKVTREVGESLLRQEMLRYGFPFDLVEGEQLQEVLNILHVDNVDELYGRVGEGRLRLYEVMGRIKSDLYGGKSPLFTPTGAFNKVELTTLDPVCVKLSSCCKPNPTAKDNCALLTEKGFSVHNKKCTRLHSIKFRREDAVNITWKLRETTVGKQQEMHILRASRKDVMTALGDAPEDLEVIHLQLLSGYPTLEPAWQLNFSVPHLQALQKVLRHFDKSNIPYEFYLEC
jgi:GTP pyrophosphokinase